MVKLSHGLAFALLPSLLLYLSLQQNHQQKQQLEALQQEHQRLQAMIQREREFNDAYQAQQQQLQQILRSWKRDSQDYLRLHAGNDAVPAAAVLQLNALIEASNAAVPAVGTLRQPAPLDERQHGSAF